MRSSPAAGSTRADEFGAFTVRAHIPIGGAGAMIRVALVDDQALFRAGIRMLVDSQPDLEVVAEAADGREAIDVGARVAARTSCSWTSACR